MLLGSALCALESRARENRTHGSEGGAVHARPYPYVRLAVCESSQCESGPRRSLSGGVVKNDRASPRGGVRRV